VSSLKMSPSKPISPRMISPTTRGDVVAGAVSSIAEKTTCAVIAIGRSRSALKGRKSRAASASRDAATIGNSRWLSTFARPWPGMCLTTGATPPAIRPSA